jgi:4-hydroxy-tetrahydrodipicolinate reductase
MKCLDAGVPVICGSTGWLEKLPEVEAFCKKRKVLFYVPAILALV